MYANYYNKKSNEGFFFYFLLLISRENIILGQIFKVEILMDLHVLRAPESENHILKGWFVYQYMCVCFITLTPKQFAVKI